VEQTQFPVRQPPTRWFGAEFQQKWASLRDIIKDQVGINDEIGKKIHATGKLQENINAKMDSFIVATQNQLSFNKMLET
jgi:hypothetical protein